MLYAIAGLVFALIAEWAVIEGKDVTISNLKLNIETANRAAETVLREATHKADTDHAKALTAAWGVQQTYEQAVSIINSNANKPAPSMFDPGRKESCPNAVPAAGNTRLPEATSAKLSEESARFLQRNTGECQARVEAYYQIIANNCGIAP